jgi:DNA-binding GntR family transcriptional regulator
MASRTPKGTKEGGGRSTPAASLRSRIPAMAGGATKSEADADSASGEAAGRRPKGRGAQYVYAVLRERILDLTMRPGAKLDEMSIVQSLGVSRTPVREALIRMASDGLVFLLPNHGAQVASLDLLDMAQYFEALELTERVVSRWAAIRRTDEDLAGIHAARAAYDRAAEREDYPALIELNRDFHAAITTAAHNIHIRNARLLLLDQGMRLHRIWYNGLSHHDPHKDVARTRAEHDRMVEALERRDADLAEDLARSHVETFRQRLNEFLSASLAHTIDFRSARKPAGRPPR